MSEAIATLQPDLVWRYFDKISQIPRGSGKEAAIRKAVVSWSREAGCTAEVDRVGNVIVRIPATPGCDQAPGIVLQCHMDMVQEKDAGTDFDFEKDGIRLVKDGDWITADGTTLGADNGIGLAVALSFMEMTDLPHGPLEILATVEEETGLTGASGVTPDTIRGRLLFNLDSEEDGIFYAGCAGGRDMIVTLPVTRVAPKAGTQGYRLSVKGLLGGHSGLDIIANRANANVLLARALGALWHDLDIALSWIVGGDKHNAIPREATAAFIARPIVEDRMRNLLEERLASFRGEFGDVEPELSLTLDQGEMPSSVLDSLSLQNLLGLLIGLPHGVKTMMRDVPGIVETSNNVARVRTEKYTFTVLCSARSSVRAGLDAVTEQIKAISTLGAARMSELSSYPGWKPNMASPMLERARKIWREVHGAEPEVTVVHAGLECGIIGEKLGDMDMISLGPTIERAHSPEERVSIESVARFFEFAKAFVQSFAGK